MLAFANRQARCLTLQANERRQGLLAAVLEPVRQHQTRAVVLRPLLAGAEQSEQFRTVVAHGASKTGRGLSKGQDRTREVQLALICARSALLSVLPVPSTGIDSTR